MRLSPRIARYGRVRHGASTMPRYGRQYKDPPARSAAPLHFPKSVDWLPINQNGWLPLGLSASWRHFDRKPGALAPLHLVRFHNGPGRWRDQFPPEYLWELNHNAHALLPPPYGRFPAQYPSSLHGLYQLCLL